MIKVKEEYPYKEPNGVFRTGLVRHWAEDENGKKYILRQVETGCEYGEAVDVYPCHYTYEATDKAIEDDSLGE